VQPPAGRLAVGDRVEAPGGRRGRVVAGRLIATNGAWRYTVALDDGTELTVVRQNDSSPEEPGTRGQLQWNPEDTFDIPEPPKEDA